MIFASLCLLIAAFATVTKAQVENTLFVDDLLEHNTVNHTWMEIGYASLSDTEWTTITTTVNNLNPNDERDISVFMSLPEYGGPTATEGWPMVVKMNGRAQKLPNGHYQFQARLVQPNDSFCPQLWWTPQPSPTLSIGWMIVEEGVYNVSTSMMQFGSGEITRDNSEPMLKYDTPALYHAKYVMNYTTGCNPDDLDAVCEFVEKVSDFEPIAVPYKDVLVTYSATGWSHLGATNQLQTSVNKVPDGSGKELWMNTRVRHVFPDRIVMMLAVHSVFVNYDNPTALKGPYNYNFTLYPDYADIHTPEIASYFVWEKNMRLTCIEGLVMETSIQFPITDQALRMEYFYNFETTPGLFGMIGTLNSVGDTTSLRVFNRSKTGANYITQEDQCTDEEENHHTAEAAFTMVVGKADDILGDTRCFIAYDVKPCNYTIYLYDLFMDGWDNVELVVNTGTEELKFTTSCGNKAVTFTSHSCTWNAWMQTSDGELPITWWENYWRYEHNGALGVQTVYVGDYDSTISVVRESVWFTDLANTRVDAKENKCEQCKVAPPPPAKGAAAFGQGDGDGNGNGNGDNGGVADLSAGNVAPAPPDGVGVAPGDAGAPWGTLQMLGLSAPNDANAAPGSRSFTAFYALNVAGLGSAVDSIGFYHGAAGATGPAIHFVDVTGLTNTFYVEGSFLVSEDEIIHWINGEIYIQVNTVNHVTGEIRAQAVLPNDWVEYYINYYYDADNTGTTDGIYGDGFGNGSGGNDDGSGAGLDDDKGRGGGKGGDKGGKKSKPKPKPVLIELFDEGAIGWYNNSGSWSYPMKQINVIRRRQLNPKIALPPKPVVVKDTASALFPDILMYPKYVIMTADRTKQLHVGSLCPHRGIERCEERLPPNGEFVFRVTGKDLEDDATWKFCGVEGYVGQELQFEMKKGKCVPISVINAYTYCSFNTLVTVEGGLVLTGISTDFSEVDTKVLENEISSMLVSTTKLAINSWHVNEQGSMEVSFEATFIAENHGIDGSMRENVDTLVATLQTNMQTAFSTGAFKASLDTILQEYPQSQVTVTKASAVTLTELKVVDIEYVEASTAINSREPSTLPAAARVSETSKDEFSSIVTVCAIVGVVVAVAALVVRTRQTSDYAHQELAVDSEHADSIPEFDLGLEETAPRGLFFSSKDRF
jgi:hypothetical protein